jgi:hypothetical protein
MSLHGIEVGDVVKVCFDGNAQEIEEGQWLKSFVRAVQHDRIFLNCENCRLIFDDGSIGHITLGCSVYFRRNLKEEIHCGFSGSIAFPDEPSLWCDWTVTVRRL